MTPQTILGIVSGILTGISMLPQLIKTLKEKKAENISYGMMFILIAGLGGWVYYGILKEDYILTASNSFSLAVNLLLLFAAVKYKTN